MIPGGGSGMGRPGAGRRSQASKPDARSNTPRPQQQLQNAKSLGQKSGKGAGKSSVIPRITSQPSNRLISMQAKQGSGGRNRSGVPERPGEGGGPRERGAAGATRGTRAYGDMGGPGGPGGPSEAEGDMLPSIAKLGSKLLTRIPPHRRQKYPKPSLSPTRPIFVKQGPGPGTFGDLIDAVVFFEYNDAELLHCFLKWMDGEKEFVYSYTVRKTQYATPYWSNTAIPPADVMQYILDSLNPGPPGGLQDPFRSMPGDLRRLMKARVETKIANINQEDATKLQEMKEVDAAFEYFKIFMDELEDSLKERGR